MMLEVLFSPLLGVHIVQVHLELYVVATHFIPWLFKIFTDFGQIYT